MSSSNSVVFINSHTSSDYANLVHQPSEKIKKLEVELEMLKRENRQNIAENEKKEALLL